MESTVKSIVIGLVLGLFVVFSSLAKEKIIYKYKKYEKFDFDALNVDGEKGGFGDLSLLERNQKKFKYRLPYRKNFYYEMRKAVARVR